MEKLIIIRTLQDLLLLKEYINKQSYVAYDVESDGVGKDARIIGFSIASEVDLGYYVILREWNVAQNALVDLPTLAEASETLALLVGKSLIMQNAGFDCEKTKDNFGIDLMPFLHTDTMILAHILDENRRVGLKELGVSIFGEDAAEEQRLMKESVLKNGGVLNKTQYELYKGDADLIGRYGAKDAILTLKLFYHFIPQLYEQKLDAFFYEDECMPLLKGPTYDLNTTGLRVDPIALQKLKVTLETECLEAKAFIYKEITPHVKDKYPATSKVKTFNIRASAQLSWLLFVRLDNDFYNLTDAGRELCKYLSLKLPYALKDKREFVRTVVENKGREWIPATWVPKVDSMGVKTWWNPESKKMVKRPKKIGDYWTYFACGKESLAKLSPKYKWVETLLEYARNQKILNTYVLGIQEQMQYNIIRPSFLQHGTTSGRYSSRSPNFQNLPRKDKRVKACIVARPGKIFVGADYSQLEPRVFASTSQDATLMACFAKGEDFYSVVGAPIFGKKCSLFKDDPDSFATLYPDLRDKSKIIALATPYGRTAMQQAGAMGISIDESSELIDRYFTTYPKVELMMLESHEMVKANGVVYNLYGRPRRVPEALNIRKIYGNTRHAELPYQIRSILNLAMNHRVQSTAASIMNRAAIACWNSIRALAEVDAQWSEVKIVLQVHDELVLEGPIPLEEGMKAVLKSSMEDTCVLPGVALEAVPKSAYTLADLK